ncbi:sigma-54-dependent Fis family transcriptional regulator [Alkalihalobacterium alkalinitrilicum]|uniref:sigma-54-dependent Fis family transcriptional regulator n=1 Tax=Alkalihalobacterium alkalinitrilicum TaxID=427920 RepID=UPI000994E227|nr:sigma-54-dependent Fis family transcriptional regulator [Alkalihalobacterium alkalinitrilicum]
MKNNHYSKKHFRSFNISEEEKVLKNTWRNYFKKGIDLGEVRPVIMDSWKRSQSYNINPNWDQATTICKQKEILKRRETNKDILTLIRPFMDDLFEIVKGTDSIIAFADKDGIVLELFGDSEIALNAASVNFKVGVDMCEKSSGTNSIALSLVHGKAIQVVGPEHYCVVWHTSHCSSAPIKDPYSNEIIGVITLVGYYRSTHPHSFGLVRTAADTIMRLIEQNGMKKEKYMINNYFSAALNSVSDGILIVNRLGEIIRINKIAAHLLKISLVENKKYQISDIPQLEPLSKYIEDSISGNEIILQDELNMLYEEKFKLLFTSRKIVVEGQYLGNIIILKKKVNKELKQHSAKYNFTSLIGKDQDFIKAIKLASKAAKTDKSILIIGESGTGKELFAQAIHNESERQFESFVAINCAAIPKDLISSELFGYAEGAFTSAVKGGKMGKFEAANGGTIFLDEIGDMALELQAHLLRVLEEREITPVGSNVSKPIDVRVIAATNKDLFSLVEENKFRLDLLYRLNVISIKVPPLRKRKQDIELFIKHYLPTKKICPNVLNYFYEYDWPGNLREMRNVMEQLDIFCEEEMVTEEYLPEYIRADFLEKEENTSLYQSVANETKKETMVIALENSSSVSDVAKKLGVSPSTLYRWASEYQINMKDYFKKTKQA